MDDNKNGEWAYLKDPKEVKLEELRNECCPPLETSDEDCVECLRIGNAEPMKAMKNSKYCEDCANILFSA